MASKVSTPIRIAEACDAYQSSIDALENMLSQYIAEIGLGIAASCGRGEFSAEVTLVPTPELCERSQIRTYYFRKGYHVDFPKPDRITISWDRTWF